MAFELPALPYADDALEPNYSANTFSFHHKKHHNAYVTKLNELIAGTDLEGKSLEEIVRATAGDVSKAPIFNNAAQVWNHTFFWHSMKPNGGGKATGDIPAKIDADLGSYEKFVEEFKAAAITQFGSGCGIADDLRPYKLDAFIKWLRNEIAGKPSIERGPTLRRALREWPTPGHLDDKTVAVILSHLLPCHHPASNQPSVVKWSRTSKAVAILWQS